MKYLVAMFLALAAYPAQAEVSKGTIFNLVQAGVCIRADVIEEIVAAGSRAAATQKLHDFYRMTVNGVPVCQKIESQRFLVLDVIRTAVMDGITFQFVQIAAPDGAVGYTLITSLAKEEAA